MGVDISALAFMNKLIAAKRILVYRAMNYNVSSNGDIIFSRTTRQAPVTPARRPNVDFLMVISLLTKPSEYFFILV